VEDRSFFKTCKTRFSLREEGTNFEFDHLQGKVNRKNHTDTKLKQKNTKITTALETTRQKGGQEVGSPHAPRSWPPPRLPEQVPPA
jgi:hypothetical protein